MVRKELEQLNQSFRVCNKCRTILHKSLRHFGELQLLSWKQIYSFILAYLLLLH